MHVCVCVCKPCSAGRPSGSQPFVLMTSKVEACPRGKVSTQRNQQKPKEAVAMMSAVSGVWLAQISPAINNDWPMGGVLVRNQRTLLVEWAGLGRRGSGLPLLQLLFHGFEKTPVGELWITQCDKCTKLHSCTFSWQFLSKKRKKKQKTSRCSAALSETRAAVPRHKTLGLYVHTHEHTYARTQLTQHPRAAAMMNKWSMVKPKNSFCSFYILLACKCSWQKENRISSVELQDKNPLTDWSLFWS